MLLEGIILTCSLQLEQNRTNSAVYHLITGKKSIQTVQDAHVYRLKQFYGVDKLLTKQEFNQVVEDMDDNSLIESTESGKIVVTPEGKRWMRDHASQLKLDTYNGLLFHSVTNIFYDRLLLFIQALSNSSNNNHSYIPVIDKSATLQWMRSIYKQLKPRLREYFTKMHEELHQLLSLFTSEEASIYVDRLTGYRAYGSSKEQIALTYNMTSKDIQLIIERMNHQILNVIMNRGNSFPVCAFLIKDLTNKQFITDSAERTYQLLKKDLTVSDIKRIRRIKENTVYDHIVEIALFTQDFQVNKFVPENERQQIIEAVQKENSYKLKSIKQSVAQSISYFQIRLVLATMQHTGDQDE